MHPMRSAFLILCILLALSACSSSSTNTRADADEGDPIDVLDNATPNRDAAKKKAGIDGGMVLPGAPEEPSLEIDGLATGWDLSRARAFKDPEDVELGKGYWDGPEDASMRVAIQSDPGFVYFWLEVRDDKLIERDDRAGRPIDAVTVWLQDHQLQSTLEALPKGYTLPASVRTEVGLTFKSDGTIRDADSGAPIETPSIITSPLQLERGWGVEVAIAIEVMPFVAAIPLDEIAFRVELLDGDEPSRAGAQTRISTLPDRGDGSPRYAIYGLGGVLPHRPPGPMKGHPGGLGLWQRGEDQWSYTSLEKAPKYFDYVADTQAFVDALSKTKVFAEMCSPARNDSKLVDAYRSRSGKHRVGLVVCSTRATSDTCPSGAETRVTWVHMTPDATGEGWRVKRAVDVFDKPLEQCADAEIEDKPFFSDFSMTPLDFIDAHTWAIGWRKRWEAPGYLEEVDGATVMHTKRERPKRLMTHTYKMVASEEDRSISRTQAYFVPVDEVDGHDLCEIERVEEQECKSFNKGCSVREHGKTVLSHTKMWEPSRLIFEPYMLSKHPKCKSDFRFSERDGYMLLHVDGHIGLLPSPKLR